MAIIRITPDIAKGLIRQFFGDKFEFEIVGSLVTSQRPQDAQDIDFIITEHDFRNRLQSRLKPPVVWKDSDYFPTSSFKTTIEGITFNAVVLSPSEYLKWKWAAQKLMNAPAYLKPSDKGRRIDVWKWLTSIAPVASL